MPETLKPCPFCGGTESLRFAGLNLNSGGGYRHVYCDRDKGGCGAQARSTQYTSMRTTPYVSERQAEAEAARLWNARQPDKQVVEDWLDKYSENSRPTEQAIADWLDERAKDQRNQPSASWYLERIAEAIRSGKWREGGERG